jgi:CheY-like chemotaxis protein
VPIVALTANVMAKERERYLAAGMVACLMKPIDWGELFAALARHGGEGLVAARAEVAAGSAGSAAWEEPPAPMLEAGMREVSSRPATRTKTRGGLLVDWSMIDQLEANLPAEAFADFLRRGIETAERACGQLVTLPAGSEELVRAAHSLRGTSGTFGLRQVSVLAGKIEAAALERGAVSDLVEQLATAVAATRAELREATLLPG